MAHDPWSSALIEIIYAWYTRGALPEPTMLSSMGDGHKLRLGRAKALLLQLQLRGRSV